jgi:hypothetical protein
MARSPFVLGDIGLVHSTARRRQRCELLFLTAVFTFVADRITDAAKGSPLLTYMASPGNPSGPIFTMSARAGASPESNSSHHRCIRGLF